MGVGRGGQEVGRRWAGRFGEMLDDGVCMRTAVLPHDSACAPQCMHTTVRRTCASVPETTTFLESVPGSTSLLILRLQPLCSRSSRILAPALPMRPPAAW